jgi:hypothetical protein
MNEHAKHVEVLAKRVASLSETLAKIGKDADLETGETLKEFLIRTRLEKFTRPAEFYLIELTLDSIDKNVIAIKDQLNGLVTGAKLIVGK